MRERLWQHRMAAMPVAIVTVALLSVLVYKAIGSPWPLALSTTLFNAPWWAGLSYLYVRTARKRKRASEKRGIISYIRYPAHDQAHCKTGGQAAPPSASRIG